MTTSLPYRDDLDFRGLPLAVFVLRGCDGELGPLVKVGGRIRGAVGFGDFGAVRDGGVRDINAANGAFTALEEDPLLAVFDRDVADDFSGEATHGRGGNESGCEQEDESE